MASRNLWGDIISEAEVRTPTIILKEQAKALTEMTKGVLVGKTTIETTSYGKFTIFLSVLAPRVNDYKFDVAIVEHDINLYPATVVAAWERYSGKEVTCKSEDEIIVALERILSSDQVTRAIRSLIAQSKS